MSLLPKSHAEPVLCYITDRKMLSQENSAATREALLRKIEEVAAAGVDWIQVREKDLSGRDCAYLAREAQQRAIKPSPKRANPTRIIVNDRLDVALSEGVGGVHLGGASLPVAEVRRFVESRDLESEFLIGVSCHSLEAARAAEGGGADYMFFGPVFATPSKAACGAPQGLEQLSDICRAVSLPVLAIGGVTLLNAASCFAAGAAGIAAIRLFQDAPDVAFLIRTLRAAKV